MIRINAPLATSALILSFIVLSVNCDASEKAINATAAYGLDTNPHELGSDLVLDELDFAKVILSLNSDFKEMLFISAEAEKSVYFDDARADLFTGSAEVALRHDFSIGERQFNYQLQANYLSFDKTFVNKSTGLVAQVNGISAGDRYDATTIGAFAELSYRPYSYLNLLFSFQQADKQYEELEIPNLDSLDYIQQGYFLGLEYDASENGNFFLNSYFDIREFESRRGKDLAGVEIDDTLLSFETIGLNIGYRYRPSEKILWEYTYNYNERRDTVSGYYNGSSGFISISASHQFGDYQYFTGSLKYSELTLVNELLQNIDPFDEDIIASKGGTINLGYELVIATMFDTKFAFYIDLEYSEFINIDTIYTYEKSKAFAGIRWSGF